MNSLDMFAPGLPDDAVEALLTGHGDAHDPLTSALAALRRTAVRPAPTPRAGLAELLAAGSVVDELTAHRTRTGVKLFVVAAGVAATLTLSGVAAANDALPDPAERVVTDVINTLTPFNIGNAEPQNGVPAGRVTGPSPGPAGPSPSGSALPSAPRLRQGGPGIAASTSASASPEPPGAGSTSGDGDHDGGGTRRSGRDGGGGDQSDGSGSGSSDGSGDGPGSPTPTPTATSSDGGSGGSGDGSGERGPGGGDSTVNTGSDDGAGQSGHGG